MLYDNRGNVPLSVMGNGYYRVSRNCVCVIRCGMKCALLDILENVFYTKDYYHLFNQRQLEEG
jgi:hypothetical protein